MKLVKHIALTLIAFIAWLGFVVLGVSQEFLLKPFAKDDTPEAFVEAAQQKVQSEYVGNIALGLIANGEIIGEYYYSSDNAFDRFTLFQMASVSKWITSWAIHDLIEDGVLDLDKPVSAYLTRWNLPETEFDNGQVTIRRLLSHTAGLVDGLGYAGFEKKEEVQSIEASLTMADDAWGPGATKVGYEPGTQYRYSGGGYTLMQLIIEEVSGISFAEYMKKKVFDPLEMNRSTFVWSDTLGLDLATSYNRDSTVAPHFYYTALAAASLYTCVDDMRKFIKANTSSNPILMEATKSMMMEPIVLRDGRQIRHALGPMIFGKNANSELIIGHDGSNRPAIYTAVRMNPSTEKGIVVLSTGSARGIASQLGDEWIHLQGLPADYTVIMRNKTRLISILVIGIIGILATSVILAKR